MRTVAASGRRCGLDELINRMGQPGFRARYALTPPFRESNGHVSPTILAASPPRSRYVSRWRRHARTCATCNEIFRYFGLKF
jgi:hypothetical protein